MYNIKTMLEKIKTPFKNKKTYFYTDKLSIGFIVCRTVQVSRFYFYTSGKKTTENWDFYVFVLFFKNTLIMLKPNSIINQSVNNAMWLRTFNGKIQIKSFEAINFHKADYNKSTTTTKLLIYLLSARRIYFKKHCLMD